MGSGRQFAGRDLLDQPVCQVKLQWAGTAGFCRFAHSAPLLGLHSLNVK
jgi:hypothetical protein